MDTVDDLYSAIVRRLAEPTYPDHYDSESDFEAEVWSRITRMVGNDAERHCLTSHTERLGRSAVEWERFCQETPGPDVNVLGSNNRLDIVVKHPEGGSIGIEVKWLGDSGHTGKLTQGLGQAMLALANRDDVCGVCGGLGEKRGGELVRPRDNSYRLKKIVSFPLPGQAVTFGEKGLTASPPMIWRHLDSRRGKDLCRSRSPTTSSCCRRC